MKSERFEHLKHDFYDAKLVERVAVTCDDKNYKATCSLNICGQDCIIVFVVLVMKYQFVTDLFLGEYWPRW